MKIRKKEPGFPGTLIEYAKSFIKKVGVFFCTRSHLSEEKCDINVQRGIVRTNCIDSLDRTNEGQEYVGLYVFYKQLKKLGIILKQKEIRIDNPIGQKFKKMFDELGDIISLQYGGSEAHHSSLNKKKNFFKNQLPELLTSVKRHYANNFLDPKRQVIINLFLGVQNVKENLRPDQLVLPNMTGKWWEPFLRKYEPSLPIEF